MKRAPRGTPQVTESDTANKRRKEEAELSDEIIANDEKNLNSIESEDTERKQQKQLPKSIKKVLPEDFFEDEIEHLVHVSLDHGIGGDGVGHKKLLLDEQYREFERMMLEHDALTDYGTEHEDGTMSTGPSETKRIAEELRDRISHMRELICNQTTNIDTMHSPDTIGSTNSSDSEVDVDDILDWKSLPTHFKK